MTFFANCLYIFTPTFTFENYTNYRVTSNFRFFYIKFNMLTKFKTLLIENSSMQNLLAHTQGSSSLSDLRPDPLFYPYYTARNSNTNTIRMPKYN